MENDHNETIEEFKQNMIDLELTSNQNLDRLEGETRKRIGFETENYKLNIRLKEIDG